MSNRPIGAILLRPPLTLQYRIAAAARDLDISRNKLCCLAIDSFLQRAAKTDLTEELLTTLMVESAQLEKTIHEERKNARRAGANIQGDDSGNVRSGRRRKKQKK